MDVARIEAVLQTAAPSPEQIRDLVADLDHGEARRLRFVARFFLDLGPPLLKAPADEAAERYGRMLRALAGNGFADYTAILPATWHDGYFRRLLQQAAVFDECLAPAVPWPAQH